MNTLRRLVLLGILLISLTACIPGLKIGLSVPSNFVHASTIVKFCGENCILQEKDSSHESRVLFLKNKFVMTEGKTKWEVEMISYEDATPEELSCNLAVPDPLLPYSNWYLDSDQSGDFSDSVRVIGQEQISVSQDTKVFGCFSEETN